MATFPWYHGAVGRDDADQRLRAACNGARADANVFLVRDKSNSDRDLVLSWMNAQKQIVTHFIIKMMGAGNDKTYFLDAEIPGKTRYFNHVEDLINHFMNDDSQFPGGPLAVICQTPLPQPIREPAALPPPPPERHSDRGPPGPDMGSARINPNMNRRASQVSRHSGSSLHGRSPSPPADPLASPPLPPPTGDAPPPLPGRPRPSQQFQSPGETANQDQKKGCVVS
eukprot:TRINITY_DN12212_c0_g2_i2.p1 TRINITY_DN12212_c0_g2~~TRINITY_DN12212_c0_g2_i2.p1  ORF type:complete len:226 (+),score=30.41 TRINITY_DN12212_c0_g2_i2:153-830(+)